MTVEVEVSLSLILSLIAMVSTIVSMVIFIMKLRWEADRQAAMIGDLRASIKEVADKHNNKTADHVEESRQLLDRIGKLEKSIIELSVDVRHITEALKELKEKLPKAI